jgi:exosortase C (VPDSG-CTERM-specific)
MSQEMQTDRRNGAQGGGPLAGLTPPVRRFFWWAAAVTLGLSLPLWTLAKYTLAEDLFSHLFLIPVISGYLIYSRRAELKPAFECSKVASGGFLVAGGLLGWLYFRLSQTVPGLPPNDVLAPFAGAYLCLLASGAFWMLGWSYLRQMTFPLAFLVFFLPLPTVLVDGLEAFFQHTSADAAHAFFVMTGTPFSRFDLVFQLPGIPIQVAKECSGVRSSFVLFITSVLAAHWFLKTSWRRAALVLLVIPLGILRNGFRILVIGLLCVHVDPDMIHSWIHRKGGPVFFVLSLIPFFAVMLWLRKSERRTPEAGKQ